MSGRALATAATAMVVGCGGADSEPVTCGPDGVVTDIDSSLDLDNQAAIDALRGCTAVAGNLDDCADAD